MHSYWGPNEQKYGFLLIPKIDFKIDLSQSLKWLAIAYFLVYNFEIFLWHPDTYWHAVLKGGTIGNKNLFLVQTIPHGPYG